MSEPKPNSRRNYCAVAEYYEPSGLPTASVYEDEQGPLLRVSPFGHQGPVLGMTFDRWRQFSTAVNAAVDAHFATRYSAAPQ
ncbi:hypothetical protein [Mycobacterium malmoense]|uniref:hypothetical protein n=1 Tax=Mycobacterium malmoense TaxID=1780 RepID=UPI0011474F82|nr:hypothetical protein [Mycobacterium malmoense]